jgi:DNA-binding response OmpR family regulator
MSIVDRGVFGDARDCGTFASPEWGRDLTEVIQTMAVLMSKTEGSESPMLETLYRGAHGFIRKPFSPKQAMRYVIRVLTGKS